MPTLQFKGKSIIWNHHLSVPYHALEAVPELDFQPEKASGNLLIEGDNLLALKALLPLYGGKIKCIYIDPPYNTGNEGWAYNDNANSPLLRDWLGKEVGRDDLTRHDKWLCMMTPRLKLLRELLTDDGAIFISIDDNEVHHLRDLMDEIFGEECFIAQFTWKARQYPDARAITGVSTDHEYIVVHGKTPGVRLRGGERDESKYSNPDNDERGSWMSRSILGLADEEHRPNLHYPIVDPGTKWKFSPSPETGWRYERATMEKKISEGRILFPKAKDGRPREKVFLKELQTKFPGLSSIIQRPYTADGTEEIRSIFGSGVFMFPKPSELVRMIVQQMTEGDEIILDSFSGSGTTAQAVLDLNKEDGGNRKFILVQMTEATLRQAQGGAPAEPEKNICRDITRQRIRRAIQKYGYESGFAYQRVGSAMDAGTLLAGQLPQVEQFGRYVFYLCTGEQAAAPPGALQENLYRVGESADAGVYLIYSPEYDTLVRLALNLDAAEKILADGEKKRRIVYAPACFLDEDYLRARNLEFVGLPYGLFQRRGGES